MKLEAVFAPPPPKWPDFPFFAVNDKTASAWLITGHMGPDHPNVWKGVCLVPGADLVFDAGEFCDDLSSPNLRIVKELILRGSELA